MKVTVLYVQFPPHVRGKWQVMHRAFSLRITGVWNESGRLVSSVDVSHTSRTSHYDVFSSMRPKSSSERTIPLILCAWCRNAWRGSESRYARAMWIAGVPRLVNTIFRRHGAKARTASHQCPGFVFSFSTALSRAFPSVDDTYRGAGSCLPLPLRLPLTLE